MNEPEESSGWSFGLKETLLLVCIIGFCVWVSIPNFNHDGHHSPLNTCINNLRQIDGAINEWALEKNKTTNDTPTWDDIRPYIKLDAKGNFPKCPQNGIYKLGKVGTIPQATCSLS